MNKRTILGVISVILAFIYAGIERENITSLMGISYALGSLIGAFAIAGILTFLVAGIYWVFKRKRMPGISTTVWVLCVLMLILAVMSNISKLTNEMSNYNAKVATKNISDVIYANDNEQFDKDGYLKEATTPINTQAEASGTWGEVEGFFKSVSEEERKLNNAYVRAIDAVGWETLLDFERLANDTNLEKSRQMVSQVKREVKLYKRRAIAHNDSIQSKVNEIKFGTDVEKKDFITGFNKTFTQVRNEAMQSLQYETDIIDLCGQLITFLYENQGNWVVEDDQLFFDTDEQIASYNAIHTDLELTIERQNSLLLQMRLDRLKRIEKAKSIVQ